MVSSDSVSFLYLQTYGNSLKKDQSQLYFP